ncbi:MAG TPA: hypothetical protein VHQ47_18775 [Phycisphaerae bacterium]|nr:hypothetical protein [Phycisphaerae bacterium]
MPRSRPAILAAALLIALSWLAIAALAPSQYPLHHDTPANFWFSITGIKLPGVPTPQFHGDNVILDRDRLIYGWQYEFAVYPDYPYETVSLDEAASDFPAIERELKRRAALNDPNDYVAIAYKRWIQYQAFEAATYSGVSPPLPERNVQALLSFIDQARSEWTSPDAGARFPTSIYLNFQTGLLHVARAARLYWATITFEALLFPALILFAFWPFIHRQRFRRKLLHLTLLPLLLYLPAWLGYCNSGSPAVPLGGILYPYINNPLFAPLDNFRWEFTFLSSLPPLFYPITQGRTLSYADYYTWRTMLPRQPGPISVALLCALAAAACLVAKLCSHWYENRRRNRRGFPVLPTQPSRSPN